MPPPIPVSRYLVPDSKPMAPEGFTVVDQRLLNGLPFAIKLDGTTNLVAALPTGEAARWNELDPSTLISSSTPEFDPAVADLTRPVGDVRRVPFRMSLQRRGVTIASLPMISGLRRRLPESGETASGPPVDVIVLGWQLHAGTLRGSGDFGSRVQFAWRFAAAASAFFSPLPLNPFARPRVLFRIALTRPELVVQSAVGRRAVAFPERFALRKISLP